jgi:hypothetical protein
MGTIVGVDGGDWLAYVEIAGYRGVVGKGV